MVVSTDGSTKKTIIITHIAALVTAGLFSAGIFHFHHRRRRTKPTKNPNPLAPSVGRTESGRMRKIEKFSHYIARQMGFEDESECSELIKLGHEYLKKSQGIDEKIFEYLSDEPNCDDLYVKLVEELERCILGYFAFNWDQAPQLITQVLSVDSEQKKLKDLVMAATRKQRFAKITKDLKVTRMLSTLLEEMKVMGTSLKSGNLNNLPVMVPAAISERSPVLLFMGGGMGAGKSTVLKDIMKECFWSGAAANAVLVEADAFKETDVIYRALSSRGHHQDMLQTAELVHQSSTDAASSLLVTALNEGRDVIMDGTLSWVPFVEQTIAMARNVHNHRYRMGEGYKVADDGTVTENYWVQVDDDEGEGVDAKPRKPYRIELVGVICDTYLAVVRGIRRAIHMKRAVRVKSQLKSHKRFASAFPRYSELVDNARLYTTNGIGIPPKLIAWKDGDSNLLVDPEEIKWLKSVSSLNDEADSIYDLYNNNLINEAGSVWHDVVMNPEREIVQMELREVVKKLQVSIA